MIFLILIVSEKINFAIFNSDNLYIYSILIFILTILMISIYQIFAHYNRIKIAIFTNVLLSFFIYIIPLIFILYALNFETTMTKDILYATFQSNTLESYQYVKDFIKTQYLIFALFITLLSIMLLYLQAQKATHKITSSILPFILIIIYFNSSSKQIYNLKTPSFISENINNYYHELKMFREIQKKRKSGEIEFLASKKQQGETYLVIIGESLNKNHMGVYGYKRETTPYLSKSYKNQELLKFNKVYSNHTHTMEVLSLALTQANQYNKKDYYKSLSIIEILNKADIETYWLTNQNMLGGWDNLISVIAKNANHVTSINSSIGYTITAQEYDGVLIPKVEKILSQKSEKNRVIFVHLMGNHSTYWTRYPQDNYKIYKNSDGNQTDDYDNSIVYNHYVVSSMLKNLQELKGVNALIYMPDHADDVKDNKGHGSAHFTFEMTQIPMLMWFSKDYKERYPNRYKILSKNIDKLYSNDLFYDTLIGIFDIKTDKYNRKYDLSSNDYQLKKEEALLLHGKFLYTEKEPKD